MGPQPPNFVDLQTGGYGGAIQDTLNGPQTTTLANVLAGCITRIARRRMF
jgi:hypothetical protein